MHSVITICTICLIICRAAVIPKESEAISENYENKNDGTGNYIFSFQTSNGISRREVGHLVNIGQDDEHMVVEGSYSYTDENGKLVTINYTADENGYRIIPNLQIGLKTLSPSVVATLLGK